MALVSCFMSNCVWSGRWHFTSTIKGKSLWSENWISCYAIASLHLRTQIAILFTLSWFLCFGWSLPIILFPGLVELSCLQAIIYMFFKLERVLASLIKLIALQSLWYAGFYERCAIRLPWKLRNQSIDLDDLYIMNIYIYIVIKLIVVQNLETQSIWYVYDFFHENKEISLLNK